MIKQKKIPIGYEFYKEFIDKNLYYVDKTLLIKELLDKGGKVNLFTRPRRFGKTLTLTMLKAFFEEEIDGQGESQDNHQYFEKMKIMGAGKEYTEHLGKYPVIFFSMKSAKQQNFNMAYQCLTDEINREFNRHSYLLRGDALNEIDKERFGYFMSRKAEMGDYAKSLQFLSECLEKYHGRKTIILLDEYDVPLESAYFEGFYDEMVSFVRSLFESALKTNDSLELAVLTGCLRISKESIFTGLNNLKIVSILDYHFSEYFGFTQQEVHDMLGYYGIDEKVEDVKAWYDGYLFGDTEVYNPWSVVNYVYDATSNPRVHPKPYWSNTSSNSIIKELIEYADDDVKREIEELIAGGIIEKQVHEDITYGDVHESMDNLWNFLYFTGYMKKVSERFEDGKTYLSMKVPNEEIRYIYSNTIQEWFQKKIKASDFSQMYKAILDGQTERFESILKDLLRESISYNDNQENFYHGFLVGILKGMQGYRVLSDRESGAGRPDILLEPYDEKKSAVIIEIKWTKKLTLLETKCGEALIQIEDGQYEQKLQSEGYSYIKKYGICFCKKTCLVKTV